MRQWPSLAPLREIIPALTSRPVNLPTSQQNHLSAQKLEDSLLPGPAEASPSSYPRVLICVALAAGAAACAAQELP